MCVRRIETYVFQNRSRWYPAICPKLLFAGQFPGSLWNTKDPDHYNTKCLLISNEFYMSVSAIPLQDTAYRLVENQQNSFKQNILSSNLA